MASPFQLFINDVKGFVKHSNLRLFADDTRVFKQIDCQNDVLLLEEDPCNIISWSSNDMKPYQLPFMTKCMPNHVLNGKQLHPVQNLQDIGVIEPAGLYT